ncbi:MAG: glycerol-3-phosphate 1-O-acyltransferase PlsY [Lachnospiraceae bacterium]|nr:glycerol-3-phosphate 1-O-acyltransferase PlsY [Lachnospiraceae bacterium]
MVRVACLAIGYCFGLFQTAFIYGKMNGIDIREKGSGNAGTTNALRVLGKKAGIIVFFGDALKALFAMILVHLLFGKSYPDMTALLRIYAGAGAILGHNFPFYMGFRGGKGIAATGGISLGMAWQCMVAVAITFFSIFFTTHYVSLGSLCMYVVFVIALVVMGQSGSFNMPQPMLYEMYVIALLLAIMAFVRHRGNIKRLIDKNERKTYLIKKNKED